MFPIRFASILIFLKNKFRIKQQKFSIELITFCLSLIDPRPRTIILQPVSASSCFAVIPRGPKIRPTKLNYKNKKQNIKSLTQFIILLFLKKNQEHDRVVI